MFPVLINGFTEDKNIIYVDNAEFTEGMVRGNSLLILQDEINFQRIERQLNCEILQQKIEKFQSDRGSIYIYIYLVN